MIYTADYTLEIRRIVLENEVNTVYICSDRRSENRLFYTCICIRHMSLQKEILAEIVKGGIFKNNKDYKGHFIYEGTLNLLFTYHDEQLMQTYMDLYVDSFKKKKRVCKSLVGLCQALEINGKWLTLLLKPNCMNLNKDGSIYFNYFLDLRPLVHKSKKNQDNERLVYKLLGEQIFDILTDEYHMAYASKNNPKALVAFQKKLIYGFKSYKELYRYLNWLPDEITEKERFRELLMARRKESEDVLKKYGLNVMMWLLILIAGACGFKMIREKKDIKPVASYTYKQLYHIGNVVYEEEGK